MIATIVSWFTALFKWIGRLFEWFKGIFVDLMEFITDLPLVILRGFLDGVLFLLESIPVPSFIHSASLQALFNGLHPDVQYFVSFFGIHIALGIIGAGVLFRLTRKAFTLGQW
jgi:hypothetical protein